jgi:hypothetical protein
MNKYQTFCFESYAFNVASKELKLTYLLDDVLTFTETYTFNFDFVKYDEAQLDRAVQNLFFMAGVSYYKAYVPPEITITSGQMDELSASFFSKTYQRGLGEFFYVNNLDPLTPISFPPNIGKIVARDSRVQNGLLIGLGGGKDSLLSVELLRAQPRVATWSLGHESQLAPLVTAIGLSHFTVERTWDKTLLEHNKNGALNGHVPISAIFACVGTIVGILSGYDDAVVSNEHSANEPTLTHNGVPINHQYSKSLEFEQDYQSLLAQSFGDSLRYFSFLRPLTELYIGELFAKYGFEKYKDVFSSCNRAFVHTSHEMFWCGECPKCAFVFLVLTPFVERAKLETLWHGKNLLLDPELTPIYNQLLGIDGDKPLDCVGEIKETRAAMKKAQDIYPELSRYVFELPEGYNFKELAPHNMPQQYYAVLQAALI